MTSIEEVLEQLRYGGSDAMELATVVVEKLKALDTERRRTYQPEPAVFWDEEDIPDGVYENMGYLILPVEQTWNNQTVNSSEFIQAGLCPGGFRPPDGRIFSEDQYVREHAFDATMKKAAFDYAREHAIDALLCSKTRAIISIHGAERVPPVAHRTAAQRITYRMDIKVTTMRNTKI